MHGVAFKSYLFTKELKLNVMTLFRLITLLVFVLFISNYALAQKTNSLKPAGHDQLQVIGKRAGIALTENRIFGLCDYMTINQNVMISLNAEIKWRNTIASFPERYSTSGLPETMFKIQPNAWLASAANWDGDFPNPRGERPSFHQFSKTGYYYLPLQLPQNQKIIFKPKSKIWHPRGEDIIIGAVFAGIGSAILLTRPVPDFFSDDAKVGPMLVYMLGGSSALVGTITMFSGILHRAKVNQQSYDPSVSTGQLSLVSSAENNKALSNIAGILQQGNIRIRDKANGVQGIPKQVTTFDDRIEIMTGNQKSVLSFKDLYICGITTYDGSPKIFDAGFVEFKYVGQRQFQQLGDLKNNLNYIRNQFEKQARVEVINDRLNTFKPFAARYRSMVEPPVMSENQRKLVVQANTLTEQMQYSQAINKLHEAQAIDPVAYPTGYNNLALLYARLKNYDGAILNMKKYLLLVPDAPDARDAQDKIYEWELLQK
jgi:hypothetical protein